MSDPKLNSDFTEVGALGCLCALAGLLIRSLSHRSLSTSSILSGGQRWRSLSNTLIVHNWPSHESSACTLTLSYTSRMRFRVLRSMPGALGLMVALETTDSVGDMEVGGCLV